MNIFFFCCFLNCLNNFVFCHVRPAGIEPASLVPETNTLSIKLRAPFLVVYHKISQLEADIAVGIDGCQRLTG